MKNINLLSVAATIIFAANANANPANDNDAQGYAFAATVKIVSQGSLYLVDNMNFFKRLERLYAGCSLATLEYHLEHLILTDDPRTQLEASFLQEKIAEYKKA